MPQDLIFQELTWDAELNLCEDLAPIIEKYGLATVENALEAIKESGAWTRTTDEEKSE